jgi:hypothetical protein
MSGIKPLFVSAPRLLIRFNTTNVAYAVGISIDVSVDVRPVFTLGQFGALSYEPTMYQPVRGSMQLLKLIPQDNPGASAGVGAAAAAIASNLQDNRSAANFKTGAQSPFNSSDNGWNSGAAQLQKDNSLLKVDSTFRHLDPTRILLSSSFDITMYLNVDHDAKNAIQFMNITDCRLTGRSVSIAIGQLLAEPVTFEGLLAQSAGFSADALLKDGVRKVP